MFDAMSVNASRWNGCLRNMTLPMCIMRLRSMGRWNGEDYYENLWLTNAVGTKNVLRLQERKKFRLVFFGSAEVYGDYGGVMSEDVMEKVPIRQMNDYAISKWVNELQIMNSADMFGSEAVRVRLFNVYGPGEVPGKFRNLIPNFMYRAMNGIALSITGTGEEIRDFTYVEDIVDGTLRLGVMPAAVGEAINLASETESALKFSSPNPKPKIIIR